MSAFFTVIYGRKETSRCENPRVWKPFPRVEALPTLRPWPGLEPLHLNARRPRQNAHGSKVPRMPQDHKQRVFLF